MSTILDKIRNEQCKNNIPSFGIGDTVRVHLQIVEGNKMRIQQFSGTVIARSGSGIDETITVRRVSYGLGIERVFPLHSPRLVRIDVEATADVRRAKLYYLREKVGKNARVKMKVRGAK